MENLRAKYLIRGFFAYNPKGRRIRGRSESERKKPKFFNITSESHHLDIVSVIWQHFDR